MPCSGRAHPETPFSSEPFCVIVGAHREAKLDNGGAWMTFDDVLTQVLTLLQREQRVSYRALKVRFQLDDDLLEAVKDELIYAKKLAVDEDGRVLVWTGGTSSAPATVPPVPLPATSDVSPAQGETAPV